MDAEARKQLQICVAEPDRIDQHTARGNEQRNHGISLYSLLTEATDIGRLKAFGSAP